MAETYVAPVWPGNVGADAPVTVYNKKIESSGTKKSTQAASKATAGKATASGGSAAGSATLTTAQLQEGLGLYLSYLQELQAREQAARNAAYNAAAAQQKNNLAYAQQQLDAATDQALQEAYINRMLSLRNLQQDLSAQGITGGAAESTLAGLYNNYSNARSQLEGQRAAQLGSLLNTYQNNMAQLEAERAGGAAAALQELVPQLAELYATNGLDLLSLIQGAAAAGRTVARRTVRASDEEEDPYTTA